MDPKLRRFILINIAYAMGQGGAAAGQQGSGGGLLIPMALMFLIFYFLLIRPQQKQRKQHQEMIDNLKKGDRIITSGGLHGRITSLDDTTITMEIADKVRVKIVRNNVAVLAQPPSKAQSAKKLPRQVAVNGFEPKAERNVSAELFGVSLPFRPILSPELAKPMLVVLPHSSLL